MSLKINEPEVKKISGPVSMYLLKPTDDYLKRFPYAPILILFGDQHNGIEGFCQQVDNEKGHYKVSDVKFLRLLSDKVKGKGLIDFYVEGGDIHYTHKIQDTNGGEPMPELWNLFIKCYNNPKMEDRKILPENKPTCDLIPNIRWQSGDIRNFQKERDKCNIWELLSDNIGTAFSKAYNEGNEDNPDEFFKQYIRMTIESSRRPDCKEEIEYNFTAEEIYDLYVESKDSLINKQINRISNKETQKYIKDRFATYINEFYRQNKEKYKIFNEVHSYFKQLFNGEIYAENSVNIVLEIILLYHHNSNLKVYLEFLMNIKSLMLDLYTMARIFKTMHGSIPEKCPLINICYFGSVHIRSMYEFLTKDKYAYTAIIEKHYNEYEKINRCIEFGDQDLILNEMIDKLVEGRGHK